MNANQYGRQRRRALLTGLLVEARWRRYRDDPAGFFADCVQIPSPSDPSGRVPFVLHDYQHEGLGALLEGRFVVVLKARQLGWTTLMMAVALWELLFKPGTNILLVSKDQRTADKALGEMLDFMWQFLPGWLKQRGPRLEVDSAREHVWVFPDGMRSRIVSLPATKTAGAGETATRVIWDEAALAAEQEDTYRTLLPTTDAGGKMTVFSTARGAHNLFARLYREAKRGENQFTALFNPWWVSRLINPLADVGGIDRTHYEAKKRDFQREPWRFYAEYPTSDDEAFRQSGRSRFANLPPEEEFEDEFLRYRIEDGPRLVPDPAGPLRLHRDVPPVLAPRQKAVLSVDPATGVGGDYTAMTLGWMDTDGLPFRAGFWHANDVEPLDAARQAGLLGMWAGGQSRPALLVVEKQGGYGDTFIHELRHNLKYPNLYLHRYTGHRRRKVDVAYGFPMTAARRPLVIDRLAEWLPDTTLPDRPTMDGIDPLLRQELGAFVVKDTGRVEADDGMNDDLVMSAGIWLYVLTEQVGAATDTPKVEPSDGDPVQTFTLDQMMADIAKVHAAHDRRQREARRDFHRQARRRTR